MALKDDIAKIDIKVDKIDEKVDEMNVHMAEYNEQLKYHIHRTNILEKEHKGVMAHIHKVNGALKLIMSLGIIITIIKIIEVL